MAQLSNQLKAKKTTSRIDDQQQIENVVFDEFFANETLGFLLSPLHLVKGLLRLQAKATEKNSQAIEAVLNQPKKLESLHEALLSRASGFYIPEVSLQGDEIKDVLDGIYDDDALWLGDELEMLLGQRLASLKLPQSLICHSSEYQKYRNFYECGRWVTVKAKPSFLN